MIKLTTITIFLSSFLFFSCINETKKSNLTITIKPYSHKAQSERIFVKKYVLLKDSVFYTKSDPLGNQVTNYSKRILDNEFEKLKNEIFDELKKMRQLVLVDELCDFYYEIEVENNIYEICNKDKSNVFNKFVIRLDSIIKSHPAGL